MPGQTFTYVSATQQDPSGDAFQTVPQSPITFTKDIQFQGAATSTAAGSYAETANTRHLWTCDVPSAIMGVLERHSVIGSSTGMLVTAKGSTPLGSGINALTSTIDHTATVDVLRSGTLSTSTTLVQLSVGDAIGWRFTTPGNLAPVGGITVILQRF